jgi:flagellar hook-associated protein 3 FlgL
VNIRITGQTQVANAVTYLRAQSVATAKFSDQISSGKKVTSSSDNPAAFASIVQGKAVGKRTAVYQQTLSDATTDLNAGSSALQSVNDILVRAKQLALEGANSSTDSAAYNSLATEADSLLSSLISSTNSQQDGTYLFGGTADNAPPFRVATTGPDGKPATIAYDGAAERGRNLVGAQQTVDTKYVGQDVFQTAGADVFQALIGLRDDLRNSTLSSADKANAVSNRIGQLDTARDQIGDVIGEQGSAAAGLQAIQNRLESIQLNVTSRTGELEGTDYAEAVVKLKEQQTIFEATLAVSSKILQPTLLDFIR